MKDSRGQRRRVPWEVGVGVLLLLAVALLMVHALRGGAASSSGTDVNAHVAIPEAPAPTGNSTATRGGAATGRPGDGGGRAMATPGPTPTPTPLPPACSPGNLTRTLTTDKTTYHSGETVWLHMTATYNGNTRCAFGGDCVPFGIVRNAAGQDLLTTMTPDPCGRLYPMTLKKGTVLVEDYPWDQQPLNSQHTATTGQEVARGTYTVRADWHSLGVSGPVTIELVP